MATYKQYLALNNPESLICYKTSPISELKKWSLVVSYFWVWTRFLWNKDLMNSWQPLLTRSPVCTSLGWDILRPAVLMVHRSGWMCFGFDCRRSMPSDVDLVSRHSCHACRDRLCWRFGSCPPSFNSLRSVWFITWRMTRRFIGNVDGAKGIWGNTCCLIHSLKNSHLLCEHFRFFHVGSCRWLFTSAHRWSRGSLDLFVIVRIRPVHYFSSTRLYSLNNSYLIQLILKQINLTHWPDLNWY